MQPKRPIILDYTEEDEFVELIVRCLDNSMPLATIQKMSGLDDAEMLWMCEEHPKIKAADKLGVMRDYYITSEMGKNGRGAPIYKIKMATWWSDWHPQMEEKSNNKDEDEALVEINNIFVSRKK